VPNTAKKLPVGYEHQVEAKYEELLESPLVLGIDPNTKKGVIFALDMRDDFDPKYHPVAEIPLEMAVPDPVEE